MRCAIISFSLLLLAGCSQTEVIGCPEVKTWTAQAQDGLLKEITQPGFKASYPYTYRALQEFQDMRVTARPCALLSRPIPQ